MGSDETVTDECTGCDGEFPEDDLEGSHYTGERLCPECAEERWPDHVTLGEAGRWRDADVRTMVMEGSPAAWAWHVPTGLAAHSDSLPTREGNLDAAQALLRKAFRDVSRLEYNERYGNTME